MNVIFLNDQAHVNGGAALVALEEAKALARAGHRVWLMSCAEPVDDSLKQAGVQVCCLGQKEIFEEKNRTSACIRGMWNIQACRWARAQMASCDPRDTIVHIHSWMKAFSPAALNTVLQMGFKTVMTLHDYFIACPNGAFMDYPSMKICKRKPLSAECILRNCDSRCYAHKLWRTGRTFLQNKILRVPQKIHHYIAVSEFCANVLKPHLPKNAKVSVLNNPIDIPKELPVDVAGNKKFIFVGRFSREKGADIFARAAARMNVPALFIGDGYLREEIQKIYPGAEITGWLPHDEVMERLNQARSLVFPSIWYEANPLAPLEACARGIPVITSDQSAPIHYIENNRTGLFFEMGNVNALCEQMQHMMNPSFAAQLGQTAHQKYWEHPWTMEKHRKELLKIYEAVLHHS
ncbi:MAG: glycosyltransferase family 4 protein [Verrucomicrobiota bacterium]